MGARRRRSAMVCFRNSKGGHRDFGEAVPDDGDLDMAAAVGAYREVAHDGILCLDHMPPSPLVQPHATA